MKRKIGVILVLAILLLVVPMVADAKDYYLPDEDLTRDELTIKESEGWRITHIYIGGMSSAWGTHDGSLPSWLNVILL